MATQNNQPRMSLTHPHATDVIEFFRSQPRQASRAPNPVPSVEEAQVAQDAFQWFHNIVLTDDSNIENLLAGAEFFSMVLREDYPEIADEFQMHCDALFDC